MTWWWVLGAAILIVVLAEARRYARSRDRTYALVFYNGKLLTDMEYGWDYPTEFPVLAFTVNTALENPDTLSIVWPDGRHQSWVAVREPLTKALRWVPAVQARKVHQRVYMGRDR